MDKEQFTEKVLSAEKSMYHIAKSILQKDEDCADTEGNVTSMLEWSGDSNTGWFQGSYGFSIPADAGGEWKYKAEFQKIIDVDSAVFLLLGEQGEIRIELRNK